jgi:hypothetical protein
MSGGLVGFDHGAETVGWGGVGWGGLDACYTMELVVLGRFTCTMSAEKISHWPNNKFRYEKSKKKL